MSLVPCLPPPSRTPPTPVCPNHPFRSRDPNPTPGSGPLGAEEWEMPAFEDSVPAEEGCVRDLHRKALGLWAGNAGVSLFFVCLIRR